MGYMGWKVGEIEPCPFCGFIGEFSPLTYEWERGGTFQMECRACHALGPTGKTAEQAKALWDAQGVKMGAKLEAERAENTRLREVISEYARGVRKPIKHGEQEP